MLCYQDKTFCSAPCGTTACHRTLTDDVKRRAALWWDAPGEPPIAISDMRDVCGKWSPLDAPPEP